MNVLHCKRLAEVLDGSGVTAYSVCPGWCSTGLGRNVQMPFFQRIMLAPIFMLFQRTQVQGAQGIIYATLEDKGALKSGALYKDGKVAEEEMAYAESLDEGGKLSKDLWELSEELLRGI